MKTIVVDDWQLAVDSLLELLRQVDPEGVHRGMTSASDVIEYLTAYSADIVFLDIEMPEMTGIELAGKIKELRPEINIIFVTGHSEYAMDAHGLYVSGYLLKPATKSGLEESLRNLRHPVAAGSGKNRLRVQCFGNFEVFADEKPITFRRSKTKELLAYLVDRKGASCTMGELIAVLWEDKPESISQKNQLRNLISDLRQSLRREGLEDVLVKGWNSISVDCTKMNCDYYGFLRAEPASINAYGGEYMVQYSWAEMTTGMLGTQRD